MKHKTCEGCANLNTRFKVNREMLACEIMTHRPSELFCYATIDDQIARENACLKYIEGRPSSEVSTVLKVIRARLAVLNRLKEAEEKHEI